MHTTAARLLHALLCPLFGLCVVVQLNDPDPWRWMVIYAAALALSVAGAAGRPQAAVAAGLAAVALLWAATQGGSFLTCLTTKSACFSSWDMHDDRVAEEAREVGGLLLVAACSALSVLDGWLRSRYA